MSGGSESSDEAAGAGGCGFEKKAKRAANPLPSTLYEAMEALESDNKFIKGVVPSELLGDYLDMKLGEYKAERKAVSGYELQRYYNV